MIKFAKTSRFYRVVGALMFFVGLGPLLLNVVLDPYEVGNLVEIGIEKEKISEKSHYPLWKMAHYPGEASDLIVLGDSRARALRDKYWHELGLKGAYNFAYGGATIHEIYDTFQYVKQNKNLRTLVVGIQLRSFDPDHKGGMNRVPEAIRLTKNPLKYYSNWFVSRIGAKLLERSLEDSLKMSVSFDMSLMSTAQATELSFQHKSELDHLLLPERCANCRLPKDVKATSYPISNTAQLAHFGFGLGRWGELWPAPAKSRILTGKFNRQVTKNAKSDWQRFSIAEEFWSYLSEISIWSRKNNVRLIFVIPPTILEMQYRIAEFGHGAERHAFRKRLVSLGTVMDFDFDNSLTRNLVNFTDAYHFNYKAAKQIVGELAQLVSHDEPIVNLALKRRKNIICPAQPADVSRRVADEFMEVLEGKSCRIWREVR